MAAAKKYNIIEFKNQQIKNEEYKVIAFSYDDILGRGSYGNVYQGYPVDPATGKLIKKKKLAIKKYRNLAHINPSEAKYFNAYYGGCELLTHGDDTYLVMTCLPGQEILNYKNKEIVLNKNIQDFDFAKRTELALNIMMAINIIHHNTPNTGDALIHGDINGSNIKVAYDPETEKIDVYIIDFGLATEAEADPDHLQDADMEGTPLFMPNEIVEFEKHGIKSDIYALTPILAAIYGALNPFAYKAEYRYYQKEYYKIAYDFSGIFTGYNMLLFPFDVPSYIIKFLGRMQDLDPALRPDSDETLRFFTTLNKLCVLFQNNPLDHEVYACGAKLAILADGLWKDPITPTPEHYDFDDLSKTAITKYIIDTARVTPLNSPILKKILSKEIIRQKKRASTLFTDKHDGNTPTENAQHDNQNRP